MRRAGRVKGAEQEKLEARIDALEWVIQAALSTALGPVDQQAHRRAQLLEAIISSPSQPGDEAEPEQQPG